MFGGLKFAIPMLFIALGTLLVGTIPALLAWARIIGQWRTSGRRVIPKALCAFTLSICVILAGSAINFGKPYWIIGQQIWLVFFSVGFLLNIAALVLLRERNTARDFVRIGSISVAAIHVLGILLLSQGGWN